MTWATRSPIGAGSLADAARKRAKVNEQWHCWICDCCLDRKKLYCSPCYSDVLEARLNHKRGKPQT